ncbi:MAG: N-acetylmuramoyl-L-alanine amidase [Proteobacteria bacterium]|nr:N-acetylmuramoyl-L-alanine amidase [Pseudomonadota bacterium]
MLYSKKLRISILLLIFFIIFTGAKERKQKKTQRLSLFEKIKSEYLIYKNSKNELKDNVLKGYILKFDRFSKSGKESEVVASKYFKADINEKLFEITGDKSYLVEAIKLYEEVSKNRGTNLSLAAQKKIELLKKPSNQDDPEVVNTEKKKEDLPVTGLINLTNIKYWSDNNYTRVVVELEKQTLYDIKTLKEDYENKKPPRIVIDFKNSIANKELLKNAIEINDNLLEKIRVGQYRDDLARVVLDLKSIGKYNVFSLTDPFRVVVDIYASDKGGSVNLVPQDSKKIQEKKIESKHIFHNIKSIVIDTGHGDHDPGAIGIDGLREKDVVLDIGLRLGRLIKEYFPDINIYYTRDRDIFLPLEERTAFANSKKADLFISIHANASKNKSASGIETYFLNFAKEKRAMEVVARENATTIEGVDEVQTILKDLLISSKYNESSLFASVIQKNLVSRLSQEYNDIVDLGVKQGPFYVLLGSAMPSILVEVSFITHPTEGRRLASESYREKIAEGIMNGIKEYIERTALVKN